MHIKIIKDGLKSFNELEVDNYVSYLSKLSTEEKYNKSTKKKEKANPWMYYITDQQHIDNYKKVASQGMVIDGKHITLQSTGISFDYIALKNKMLSVYPESIIDIQLVYEGDEISFGKENGKIGYKHILSNPFERGEDKIIGGYCVIKNKRGEFLTTLNKDEIDKHRKVAKTDYIWKAWFAEMSLKTIWKKSVKAHFDDIYSDIINMDNEENDLDNNPIDIELSWKSEIDEIQTIEELKEYWDKNKGKGKEFAKYVTKRKSILESNNQSDENT